MDLHFIRSNFQLLITLTFLVGTSSMYNYIYINSISDNHIVILYLIVKKVKLNVCSLFYEIFLIVYI